jgi:hypothetical protein
MAPGASPPMIASASKCDAEAGLEDAAMTLSCPNPEYLAREQERRVRLAAAEARAALLAARLAQPRDWGQLGTPLWRSLNLSNAPQSAADRLRAAIGAVARRQPRQMGAAGWSGIRSVLDLQRRWIGSFRG